LFTVYKKERALHVASKFLWCIYSKKKNHGKCFSHSKLLMSVNWISYWY